MQKDILERMGRGLERLYESKVGVRQEDIYNLFLAETDGSLRRYGESFLGFHTRLQFLSSPLEDLASIQNRQ